MAVEWATSELDVSNDQSSLAGLIARSAQPGSTTVEVFRFLRNGLAAGHRCALITLVVREGSSIRALGSHMAVTEDGRYAGSFSGGCIESTIVAQAKRAIESGCAQIVRYGRGSQYIDIRLPCGGAVELLFNPNPASDVVCEVIGLIEARSPVTLELWSDGRIAVEPRWHEVPAEWLNGRFVVRHAPPLRLIIAGEGLETIALTRMAQAYGSELLVLSVSDDILASVAQEGIATQLLQSMSAIPEITADRWTAVVLLFHDHEWEIGLLRAALATSAFWIGAMGSRQTHECRRVALRALGIPDARLQSVSGPIGLIPCTRDPSTLALSALAEIVSEFQKIAR